MTDEVKWVGQALPAARERQREETRKKLFESALAVFRRDGATSARIDEIAKMAGVARGTFYFHFETKDDVLVDLLVQTERQVADLVLATPEDATVSDVLTAAVEGICTVWHADPKLFPDVGAVAFKMIAAGALTAESDPVRAALTERLRTALARGELRPSLSASLAADMFLAGLFAMMLRWCANPEGSLRDALAPVVNVFVYGAGGPSLAREPQGT